MLTPMVLLCSVVGLWLFVMKATPEEKQVTKSPQGSPDSVYVKVVTSWVKSEKRGIWRSSVTGSSVWFSPPPKLRWHWTWTMYHTLVSRFESYKFSRNLRRLEHNSQTGESFVYIRFLCARRSNLEVDQIHNSGNSITIFYLKRFQILVYKEAPGPLDKYRF